MRVLPSKETALNEPVGRVGSVILLQKLGGFLSRLTCLENRHLDTRGGNDPLLVFPEVGDKLLAVFNVGTV